MQPNAPTATDAPDRRPGRSRFHADASLGSDSGSGSASRAFGSADVIDLDALRQAVAARGLVALWKDEGIYPYDQDSTDTFELAKRHVFNICAASAHDHLDVFRSGSLKDRAFTLKMLRAAIDANPTGLMRILTEVFDLPAHRQTELAQLLDQTSLSAIIEASNTVSDRMKFLAGLKELLFDRKSRAALKERQQLHRILEQETWLFGEEYLLSGSDENLNTVLRKHLDRLRPGSPRAGRGKVDSVRRDDGSEGVIDLLLAREMPQYARTRKEYLVVELKRPTQKIDLAVKYQLESYALAVMKDERFDTRNTFWTFLAVSNEISEEAAETLRPSDHPFGHFLLGPNYRVGLATWAQLLQASSTRMEMFREKLDYVATKEQGAVLLHQRYGDLLPTAFADPRQAARGGEGGFQGVS